MVLDLDKGGRIPQVTPTYLGPTKGWVMTDAPTDIEFVINGGGLPITSGVKGALTIPEWVEVNSWVMLAQAVGDCQIDVWKITLDQYLAGTIPTSANSITGSDVPTLSGQSAASSTALTGWTTSIAQNDVLVFNVTGAATLFLVTLVLKCVRLKGTGQ